MENTAEINFEDENLDQTLRSIYFEDEDPDERLRLIYWCPYCLSMFEEECCCYSDDDDDYKF